MKKIVIAILLVVLVDTCAWGQIDPPDMDRAVDEQVIKYQVKISTQTADHIQEIFDKFNDSFIDYETALSRTNILINEYNKAMQLIPGPIPRDGKKLHYLTQKLLSRVEKYFVNYKQTGRENPFINAQIFEATFRVSREAERLTYQYM